jgi:hypothetical protein
MMICKGAEGGVGTRFFSNYLYTGQNSYAQGYTQARAGGGGRFPPQKMAPPCVKRGPYMYITPQQKIYAKVRSAVMS